MIPCDPPGKELEMGFPRVTVPQTRWWLLPYKQILFFLFIAFATPVRPRCTIHTAQQICFTSR